ncbi:hypothetical protein CC86DRAFT_351935 [Ophiobolus disseminans]|uniref:DNA-directed RNA polymerase III RPC4 n=1 Tax=Ophiobolus disseminans TaxID=1469910 RepID=A0A6A6ZXT9_9PLEO|nr:hypothetical protein CC86DRAFT_351935 [Ophiobolus disseminans]
MPPKPSGSVRGRGGTRPRATPRGGGNAGRSASGEGEAAANATPPSTEQAAATQAPAAPVALKQDDENDAKPPTPSENTPAPAEAQQPASVNPPAVASPQEGTDSSGRPLVQRLGSLNTSRSASPAVRRGVSTRGKRGAIKPSFTGRRSKEERAALEKEALDREKARNAERVKQDEKKAKREAQQALRDATRASRGRGGYSGAMSGPFSLGSSRDDRKINLRTASTAGSGSGSRATRIKDEEDGAAGGSSYRSSGGRSAQRAHGGGFESSEDEEDAAFPRKDIDLIEISSDENEAEPAMRPQRSTLPVRIGRKEHLERTFGINTDASTETSAKILELAESTGQEPTAAVLKHGSSKGKGKAKETEATGSRKPFKGVWQDSDELASPVKTEENSEDENMVGAEQIGIVDHPLQPAEKEEPSPEMERRAKSKVRGITEPVLQTDQDRAEWTRFQSNLSHIRAELGPDDTAELEAAVDANTADGATNTKTPTVRDNNVYLFQIPPLMPELHLPGIKREPSDAQAQVTAPPPAPPGNPEVKVKVEEGFSDAAKPHEAPRFASGCVGKLRVRQSGRTTLDWGGTSYELTPGNKTSFLQEVVSIHVVPEKNRVVPEDAGDATSFGRVKGKFVVVPDWNEMLG